LQQSVSNPATAIFGEAADFQSGIEMLLEVKESIIKPISKRLDLTEKKYQK
jgi:ATP-dependent Clp protease protease subunit